MSTAVSPMDDGSEVPAEQGTRGRYALSLGLVFTLIFIFDLVAKYIVQRSLVPGESIPLIGDAARLTLVLNRGGAFGVSIGSNSVYLVVSIIVIAVVIYIMWRQLSQSRLIDFSLSAVLAGAIGNLVDRLRYGAVVDFLDIDIPDIDLLGVQMERWPVFNVADAAVTVGMILIIFNLLFSQSETEH